MTEIKIDWLDSCPKCGCSKHIVKTEKGCGTWLYSGDAVSCGECGHTGEVEAEGHEAWVEWNEIEAGELKNEN